MVPASPTLECLRVQTLLEQAEFWTHQNAPERARGLFLKAISLETGPEPRWEYVRFLVQFGEEPAAILQLTLLWEEAKRQGQVDWGIAACERLAEIYREQGQWAIARSYQQQAISARMRSESTKSSGGYPMSELLATANDALSRGDVAFAEQLVACAMNGSDDQNHPVEMGDALGTRGAILLVKRELAPAWRCILRAYFFHCRAGDDEGRLVDLLNLAAVSREWGRWDLARRLLVKAQGIARRLNQPRLLARAERFLEEAERILAVALRVPERN